ncbi:biotin/lipoyl-containing protein, partial [Cellulomonas sp. B6]|uniref:biotin/lipoyl-containing protein n=1 Tax=Cellulomonas sp. B6 TaxID=1295626 RepID=UPI0026F45837
MPTYQQFPLPDAGEGLTEAEIVAWHVAVGDRVEVNQTIVEIETAKSLVDLPCPWTGVVTRLLVTEGTTVEVGTPIIEVDTDPDGAPAPGAPADADAQGGVRAHQQHPSRSSAEPGGADEVEASRPEPEAGEKPSAVLVGYGVADGASARR